MMWNSSHEGGMSMTEIKLLENGILLVTLQGELDNHEANRIRTELSATIFSGRATSIIWDLTSLAFMDSAGIGLILGRMRELAPVDGETLILNPSPTMEKIFHFSGLSSMIRHGVVKEAIGEIGGVLNEQ